MHSFSCKIIKNDDRIFFNDGTKYVLFDTGFVGNPFGKNSVSVNGKIGNIAANTMPKNFFESFINLKMEDGSSVDAVFNPLDGFNCLLAGDTLTVSDGDIPVEGKYFFPFTDNNLPIIEGNINGSCGYFLFDSGARWTMFGYRSDAAEKIGTYTEWMAMKRQYSELELFKLDLAFPNGFTFQGKGALVTDPDYLMHAQTMGIRAMLGIDIFDHYDMAIITKGNKRGITLIEKSK